MREASGPTACGVRSPVVTRGTPGGRLAFVLAALGWLAHLATPAS